MSLNPSGANSTSWNYTKPDQPGFSETLVGTVVAIQEVQKRAFTGNGTPGAPEFWPEGNPKMNIRLALATSDGQLVTFTFQPASKKQREGNYGIHMALYHLTGDTDMMNLIGKTIQLSTQSAPVNPATGQPMQYGSGNPRPFQAQLVQAGPYQLSSPLPEEFKVPQILANDGAHGGQPTPPAPSTIQAPQVPAQYQPAGSQGYQQTAAVPAPAPAPIPVQPTVQSAPQGMDPNVAAAMQQMTQPPANGMSFGEEVPW